MVFDDTQEHEVWNDTDEARVVLLLDVKRPMDLYAVRVLRLMMSLLRRSRYVRDAERNQRNWESTHGAELLARLGSRPKVVSFTADAEDPKRAAAGSVVSRAGPRGRAQAR